MAGLEFQIEKLMQSYLLDSWVSFDKHVNLFRGYFGLIKYFVNFGELRNKRFNEEA